MLGIAPRERPLGGVSRRRPETPSQRNETSIQFKLKPAANRRLFRLRMSVSRRPARQRKVFFKERCFFRGLCGPSKAMASAAGETGDNREVDRGFSRVPPTTLRIPYPSGICKSVYCKICRTAVPLWFACASMAMPAWVRIWLRT